MIKTSLSEYELGGSTTVSILLAAKVKYPTMDKIEVIFY